MVGVVLVTHPHLGEEFIRSAELICGKLPSLTNVSIDTRKGVEELRKEIAEAVRSVDQGAGVLILTDMFGGTPSNMSLAFLQEGKDERRRSYLPLGVSLTLTRGSGRGNECLRSRSRLTLPRQGVAEGGG